MRARVLGLLVVVFSLDCGRSSLDDLDPTTTVASAGGAGGVDAAGAAGSAGQAGLPDAEILIPPGPPVPPLPKKAVGINCAGADECVSGFCEQGVCCASACRAACATCAGPGTIGSCKLMPAGSPCGPGGSCLNQIQLVRDECNAVGDCRAVTIASCAPYTCVDTGDQCSTSCKTDGDCARNATCRRGACVAPAPVICVVNSQCATGFCAQGVCCNAPCQGQCLSCLQGASTGTCLPVFKGEPDPDGLCQDTGMSCGHNGICDGFGGCGVYPAAPVCGA